VSVEELRALFARSYGGAPEVIASAPARVNLIGEHLDYNGGEVLPLATAQRTWVAARASKNKIVRVRSATEQGEGWIDLACTERSGRWWDYIAGVAVELARDGVAVGGAEIAVWSDVPAGAGLSSSAALEVASGQALAALAGVDVDPRALALAGQRAEASFVGVSCGIMDQFASALARAQHALHLDCATLATAHLPLRECVLIFDTGVARSLRGSAFNARRAECERALELLRREDAALPSLAAAPPELIRAAALPEPLGRRALHVSEENRRVQAVVRALACGGNVPGELLLASHASLRDLYECSSPGLDWFVAHAMQRPGIRGARLTGAGWGGCAIAVGEEDALREGAPELASAYASIFGRESRWWVTGAEGGVRTESVGKIAD
jgi:galactokinase